MVDTPNVRYSARMAASAAVPAGGAGRGDRRVGHVDLDRGPLPGLAPAGEPGADPVGAGAHPGQPEMAVGHARRVEALAVVDDAEPDAVRRPIDLEADLVRARRA